jgi:hypothetical protein
MIPASFFRSGLRTGLKIGAAGAALLALAGCMSPSPYAPRTAGTDSGYTDRELTPNRYRITFSGNSVTPRETVESYLLLRAAEVTRAAGYQSFVFDTRNTKANTTYQTVPYYPAPDPWWGYRRGFGYWGGYGFAFEPTMDVIARTKFDAYAEIVLLTPDQAAREPRAVNAADVIARISPEAVMPKNGRPPG